MEYYNIALEVLRLDYMSVKLFKCNMK